MTQYTDADDMKDDVQATFVTGKNTAGSIKRDDHVEFLENVADTIFSMSNVTFTSTLTSFSDATYYYVGGTYSNNTSGIIRNNKTTGERATYTGTVANLATDWTNRTGLVYV